MKFPLYRAKWGIYRLLSKSGLSPDEPVRGLAPQLRRKLQLANAVITDPELLVIDDIAKGGCFSRADFEQVFALLRFRPAGQSVVFCFSESAGRTPRWLVRGLCEASQGCGGCEEREQGARGPHRSLRDYNRNEVLSWVLYEQNLKFTGLTQNLGQL